MIRIYASPSHTIPVQPCSLNDFMDYLYYVGENAENLQFFLWYCDYVQRWSGLLPRQKAMSPIWDPDKAGESPAASRFIRYSHKRATSDKMNKIIAIMETDQSRRPPRETIASHGGLSSAPMNYSRSRTSSLSSIMSPVDAKEDWQPCKRRAFTGPQSHILTHSVTIQPFRDEVTRAVKHYISETSPRQLNLAQHDRDACLHAISHTTHPSALLPAFVMAEANLKGCSHPAFIRWSISNAAKPRIVALSSFGVFLFVLGLAVDALLILSRLNHFLRILCILLWWPGATLLMAASKYGICLFLHFKNLRQMRPWELAYDEADDPAGKVQGADDSGFRKHSRKETSTSTITSLSSRGADPLRKPSLQTFGPKNDADAEPWKKLYAAKSFYSRLFGGDSLPVQNSSVQAMQDRAVFVAIAWAGLLASLLAVGSLFVPSGNMNF